MSEIEYSYLDQVNIEELRVLLNENSLRAHLIDHPYFDSKSLQSWIVEKIRVDSLKGCRVRAIHIDGVLAGWCGIQPDDDGFELAIVISQNFWGFGILIFKALINWAEALGHTEILFHLLETRPEYKALKKIATKVRKTEKFGRFFTTYHIPVGE